MRCSYCGHLESKVLDSRAMDDGAAIRRRRMCEACGERFTTYERLDTILLTVIKRDGTREAFNRDKILNSIMRSCNKRVIPLEKVEKLANEIENNFLNSMRKEIETNEIGELVMERLKALDEVAYVRFASVYRQFKDIDSFMNELSELLKEKHKDGETKNE